MFGFRKKEYDPITPELIEKSISKEEIWKNCSDFWGALPAVFLKKRGSDEYTLALASLFKDPMDREALAMTIDPAYYDRAAAAFSKTKTPMQASLAQKILCEKLPARPYDYEGFMKGDNSAIAGAGEYAYLALFNIEIGCANSNRLFYQGLSEMNEENGFRHTPVLGYFKEEGFRICGSKPEHGSIGYWIPKGKEKIFFKEHPELEPLGCAKKIEYASGTLHLPDLRHFEGRAEVL